MQGYNLIIVFDKNRERILLCERKKNPYKGLFNFVGGKIENNESGLDAAYRELFEETNIKREDIELTLFMKTDYYLDNLYLEVWAGALNSDVILLEEMNRLFWSSLDNDFFNMKKYAGEGNMGHMLEILNYHKDIILNKKPEQH